MMQTWNDPAALAGADRAGVIEAAKLDALDHNSSKHPVQQRDREIDLTGEWLAAGRLDGGWRTWLRRQGVPGLAVRLNLKRPHRSRATCVKPDLESLKRGAPRRRPRRFPVEREAVAFTGGSPHASCRQLRLSLFLVVRLLLH